MSNVRREGVPCRATTQAKAARSSGCIALLSLHQVRYDVEAGFLAALDYPLPMSRRSVGLTLRRHFLPTRLQSELLATLRAASEKLPD